LVISSTMDISSESDSEIDKLYEAWGDADPIATVTSNVDRTAC